MSVIDFMEKHQLTVAIRTDTPEEAYGAAAACIKGGIKLVEITFSVPEAFEVIKKISDAEGVAVGAGTVLTVADAKKALGAGASYIVSPNLDEEIVKFTKREGAVSVPGACTPTEIYRAYMAGADIIKLFPFVEIGGLDFLKAIRGPFPFIKYMLCGGATMENISAYVAAKAAGILVGSAIIRRELVKRQDWPAITELSRAFAEKVEEGLSGRG
ncbi:MAG: bifunctional 4-hydroxy-2-oxoglutarate aldolase/2-dehydro-3-deoxy-phosphogluconate aldolase [Candidatus Sulfobium sp.]|jgi:2-dehydro-3-deoxyphosphogluconate aldolase / (4S)-4-hydroxy-2-oxoglutarate aldolase